MNKKLNETDKDLIFFSRILIILFFLATMSLANFDKKQENDWSEYTYTTNVPGAYDSYPYASK